MLIVGDDGSNTLNGTAGDDLIYGYNPNGAQATTSSITGTRVATGLNQPLFVGSPPGDTAHLLIVEKTGLIKVLDLATGQILPTPFLDVSTQILTGGEQGLLGLAFDPNFAQNRYVYVSLINLSGDTEIHRYQVSAGNPNVVDPASSSLIISIDQPSASNHKGGWVGFGPDGYLYIALGDGGGSGDPFHNGQNMNSLLGKILRLDVSSDAFPGDPIRNYAVPADNPFVGVAGADEIWALGVRNPWRPSFDRGLGDFYIADVGQGTWEEIDIGILGANYGWNAYEGPAAFPGGDPVSGGTLTFPIHSYDHSVGQSITGGYVYRGTSEGLHGQYFFADFVQGKVWTLAFVGGSWVATERTSQIAYDFGTLNNPSSFGQDALGDLYVVDFDGDIFKLAPNVTSADLGDTINGMGGDDLIFGGSGNDTLSGGGDNDELQGGAGNDALDGGVGADTMVGAAGDDIYFVDNSLDRVVEDPSEGSDIVYASIDYTIGANIEAVVLIEGAGPINAAGNGTDNALIGNSGNNALDGRGGDDYMVGGAGDDIYVVDSSSDEVVENPGAGGGHGGDIVYASIDYTIGPNVEALVLVEGAGPINGAGSNEVNALIGNSENNALDGRGGNDYMVGGAGDDIYVVDTAGDAVVENPGEGGDIVYASKDYTIGANVESLVLVEGAGNINGSGSNVANALIGNSGDNVLDGKGANDFLVGNAGNDTFVFAAGEANGDLLSDFAGNGAAAGDSFRFVGFGSAAGGATFSQIGATNNWQIHSALDGHNEVITLQNSAAVHASDFIFV